MMLEWIFSSVLFISLCSMLYGEENNNIDGRSCVSNLGQPMFCYPPFQNYASTGRKVIATNTCGLRSRQKYCIGLSSAEMRNRCAYCDSSNVFERHSGDYLTDQNASNWWQSETLRDNKDLFNQESINLTLNLGNQFLVAFIHLQFKSPRPSAMVIYKKYDDNSPWEPWQYFASNCLKYFNMQQTKDQIIKRYNQVLCTEDFSSLNEFYNGVVMFATVHGRPGAEDFFTNKKLMEWSTASQIRIELRKMHTFGEQNDEEELLLTYFYAIKSLQVAARCWCNGHGSECRKSTGEGLEPQLYCVCHPSHHTTGQTCEKCDTFYQDRPWQPATTFNANICQRCKCNENADSCIFNEELFIKSGNTSGGLCLNCRWNTKGPHCNECLEGFYKDPEQRNRCIPCNCDPIGRANTQCNQQGKCTCHPGIDGDKCTRCKFDHFNFGPSGCQQCHCHLPGINSTDRLQCNPASGVCYCKKNVMGEKCDSCVPGYFSLSSGDPLGCRPCFCFAHTKECTMASGFVLDQIESEFNGTVDEWKSGIANLDPKFTPILDKSANPPSITWYNERGEWIDDYFFTAPKKFIGDRRLSYNLDLLLTLSFEVRPDYRHLNARLISMINDVQLISDSMSVSVPFDIGHNKFPEVGNKSLLYIFRLNEESGLWRDRLDHFRFQSILSNLIALRIRSTNPYGYVRLHKVVMQTALDGKIMKSLKTNLSEAKSVEKCSCPPQYTGLSCENCAPGFHREYPVGTEFVKCIKCSCNNQSDTCDSRTGMCNCKHNTEGDHCEKCRSGFYGDPSSKIRNVCQPCGCPGGTGCELLKMTDGDKVICTECPDYLGGYRCDRCRDNYFGNPKLNISCQPCECHGNIEYFSSCDPVTGKCPNCIYNSAGDYCETCKNGFHLQPNERASERCKLCICNSNGTKLDGSLCDVNTGQCSCEPLVTGQKCDTCKSGFFNLTAVKACQPCNCSFFGSKDQICDQQSGQCQCKPGVTGLHCDRCEFGYFNLSSNGCQQCFCDLEGSLSMQCDTKSGQCLCNRNVIGMKCDKCMENHHNLSNEGCQACPPCYGLIQKKIQMLKSENNNFAQRSFTMNMSDDKSWNTTYLISASRQLNETLFKIYQNYVINFEKLKELESELLKANLTLKDLEQGLTDLESSKLDGNLINLIEDIRNVERRINYLLDVEFPKSLESLKAYIANKNENNDKMTKMAESANNYTLRANKRKDDINKIWLEAEQHLNDALSSFVELIGKYNRYMSESSQFNVTELVASSNRIQIDSFENLLKITIVNQKLDNLENQVREWEKKMKALVNGTNELLLTFQKAETDLTQLEKKFKKLVLNLPDLKMLENKFKNKTNSMTLKDQVYTEASNMMAALEKAQNELKNAIYKANITLIKLQELIKDFNDVVNKSKFEAEEQMKRLPQLTSKLNEIQMEISKLNGSSIDLITKILLVHNDLQIIYNQSVKFQGNLTDFVEQVEKLLNKSEEDLKLVKQNENLSIKKLKDGESIENELNKFSEDLNKTEYLNNEQKKSVNQLEKSLKHIMSQLQTIGNQSSSSNEIKLQQYSEDIDVLSKNIENYFNNEFNLVQKTSKELNLEFPELMKDLKLTDKEISRLEMIDEHMVNIDKKICYKSGGTTEGL